MLRAETVAQIKRLLAAEKLSQRGIARRLRVSRGTVGAIALGRRPDYDAQRREAEAEEVRPARPKKRCPDCGALLVIVPCVACRAMRKRKARRLAPAGPDELALELKPEHHARYLEVLPFAAARYYEQHAGVAAGPE